MDAELAKTVVGIFLCINNLPERFRTIARHSVHDEVHASIRADLDTSRSGENRRLVVVSDDLHVRAFDGRRAMQEAIHPTRQRPNRHRSALKRA